MKRAELSERTLEQLNEVGKTLSVRDFINNVLYENDFELSDIKEFCKKEFKVSIKWIKLHTLYK